MKLPIVATFIICLMIGIGCASSGSTGNDGVPRGAIVNDGSMQNLSDFLRKSNAVMLMGSEYNMEVRVRGGQIVSTDPIYVLNGDIMPARNYTQANQMLNVNRIKYVQVLSGAAAGRYGARDGNAAIVIVTEQ